MENDAIMGLSITNAVIKPSYGNLAISLGASIFNPLSLLSGAHQLSSIFSSKQKLSENEQKAINDVANKIVDTWNYLIDRLLIPISYRIQEQVYDLRLKTGKVIFSIYTKEDNKSRMIENIATKYSRLENFCLFPSKPSNTRSRRDINSYLFKLQNKVHNISFKLF